jgi:carboxylesterase
VAEFADWSAPSSSYRISQVLLDGHGRDYGRLKLPHGKTGLFKEYEKLEALGYKISMMEEQERNSTFKL